MNVVYIYALKEPETDEIRYIGKTIDVSARRSGHYLDKSKSPKGAWISGLRLRNQKPKFEIIEKCNEDNWREREKHHVSLARILVGERLLNVVDGGGGHSGIHDGGVMKRWNFFIEQKWLDKIIQEMKRFGFRTPASFIRFIIIKFFEDVDKQQARKR